FFSWYGDQLNFLSFPTRRSSDLLIKMKGIIWDDESLGMEYEEIEIPDDMKEQAEKYRKVMLEAIADHNDVLMEKYLMEEEISTEDRKSTRLNSSHVSISYAVFCL